MDVVIILPDIKLAKFVKIAIIISIYLMVGDNGLASDEQVPEAAKWVIMIYMAADNNLEDASIFNMNQLERVGSSENTKIIVQWDRSPEYDSSNGNWTGTKRFLISKDDDEEAIGSQELEDLGEVDMGDMNSLSEFINWTLQNYPADRYALSLWNHGAGWMMHTCDDTSNTCLT
ncbi:MAG: clostripain-related cysteine peptidase, partial [Methanothrix sp.]|nr:clostripain-related cysteine peptidase [Methanothrix sp.]